MIKLITPKEDIYWEDSLPEDKPFCKKGSWYEVEYGSKGDAHFVNEEGFNHRWLIPKFDDDFWTVDFEKGFEFTRYGNDYEFKGEVVRWDGGIRQDVSNDRATTLVLEGRWEITRFSNQTPPTPEEPSHPYENWKKDIGIAKFQRCIDKVNVTLTIVEGIVGYLDEGNGLFYYHKKHRGHNTYLCCKVDRDYDASFNMTLQFIRKNKDVELVAKSSDILASFKLPEFAEELFNPEYQFKSEGQVVTDNIAKQKYFDRQMVLSHKNTSKSSVSGGEEVSEGEGNTWTDKHYDFTYTLTEDDIEAGEIKIDPYFVADQWRLGEKDNSGVIFHILKTCSRYKCKHAEEREIKAIYGQIKRLAEMRGIKL